MQSMISKHILLMLGISFLGFMFGHGVYEEMKYTFFSSSNPFESRFQAEPSILLNGYFSIAAQQENPTGSGQSKEQADSRLMIGDIFPVETAAGTVKQFRIVAIKVLDQVTYDELHTMENTVFTASWDEQYGWIVIKGHDPYLILVKQHATKLLT